MKRLLICLVGIALISGTTPADTLSDASRKVFEKYQDCVVTIKLVIKQEMSYGGREGTKQESKTEVTGTVINGEGLIVVSLSATDPSSMFKQMMDNMGGYGDEMKFNTELTDVEIILPDGKEVAAEVVLRDRDLDLAFIRPQEKPDKPFASVDLSKRKNPKVLDEIVTLSRLGKVASRVPAVSVSRIAAVVEKPRTFFVLDQGGNAFGLGVPVFNTEGAPLGIVLLRTIKTQAAGGWASMMSSPSNLGILPILLPFDDVLESAEQVPPFEEKE